MRGWHLILIVWFFLLALIYLLFAFMCWGFDPSAWGGFARTMAAVLAAFSLFLALLIAQAMDEDAD